MKQAEVGLQKTQCKEEAARAAQYSWPARAVLKIIWCYQHYISSWTPPSCRFYPTCSHYTYQSIERFGFWRGFWLGLCRLGKCHPFHKGGFDPVPLQWPSHNKSASDGERYKDK